MPEGTPGYSVNTGPGSRPIQRDYFTLYKIYLCMAADTGSIERAQSSPLRTLNPSPKQPRLRRGFFFVSPRRKSAARARHNPSDGALANAPPVLERPLQDSDTLGYFRRSVEADEGRAGCLSQMPEGIVLAVIASAWTSEDSLVFRTHLLFSIRAFQLADCKVRLAELLKVFGEKIIHTGPAQCANHRDGLSSNLPKREATWLMNRTSTGLASVLTPLCAMNRAASVTLAANIPRTAKYLLWSPALVSGRPPNANTSMHDSAVAGSEMSSPCILAISRIARMIITVDAGISTGSAANPKAPPAAPEIVARAV